MNDLACSESFDDSTPAIYVANLAAYNSGSLRGAWIHPSSDDADLRQQILDAIGGNADHEWAIHDYNIFPNLGEHPSVAGIAGIALLFEQYSQDAVIAALEESGLRYIDDAESMLKDGWRELDMPEDDAMEEYVQELADEGQLDVKFLLRHIDWASVAREVRMDAHVVEKNGKTFIFNS